MNWGRWAAFAAGLAVIAALTLYAGAGAVLRAVGTLGISGIVIIAVVHLPVAVLMGLSWWQIGRDLDAASRAKFIWARILRDAAAEVLPFSQVGGYVLGVRALSLSGVGALNGALSMSVDLVIELWAKLPYFVAGVLALLWSTPQAGAIRPLVPALALTALVVAIPLFLRTRIRGWLERSATALVRRWPSLGGHDDARAFFDGLFANPARVAASFSLHLLCWFLGAGEAWLIFALMASPVTLLHAVAIDSLVSGLRTFGFLVPAAAGVQEASYVLVCALFGIPPATAVAFSLMRRVRDFVLGVPALVIWQALEARSPASRAGEVR